MESCRDGAGTPQRGPQTRDSWAALNPPPRGGAVVQSRLRGRSVKRSVGCGGVGWQGGVPLQRRGAQETRTSQFHVIGEGSAQEACGWAQGRGQSEP